MSRVCHETGNNVENPYYSLSAVLRDSKNGKIAFSNMEASLCDTAFQRISDDLYETPNQMKQDFGYAIETQTGYIGGSGRTVQISAPVAVHGDYRFLDEVVVAEKLAKSATDLRRNPDWIEQVNGRW